MNRIIVVSKDNLEIEGVDTQKSIRDIKTHYELLIYKDSSDTTAQLLIEIPEITSRIKTVYINDNPNEFLAFLFQMFRGHVIEDTSLISKGGIALLLEDIGETGYEKETEIKSLERVKSFVDGLLSKIRFRDISEISNYITDADVVDSMTTLSASLEDTLAVKGDVNQVMARTLMGLGALLSDMERTKETLEDELEKVKKLYEDRVPVENSNSFSGGIEMYPTYTVRETSIPTMYVRSYSPTRFLTTFLLAYQDRLIHDKNRKVKVLIVIPKNTLTIKKYAVFPNIGNMATNIMVMSKTNVFYTTEPKKSVLDTFFNQRGVSLYIVIDLTYGDKLLQGAGVKYFAAAGSVREIQTFSLTTNHTFTPMFKTASSLPLFPIRGFHSLNSDMRMKVMFEAYKELYEFIDGVLGV